MMNRQTHNNIPDEPIETSSVDTNVWLEVTTLNILPGEEVLIDLENKDDTKEMEKIALSSYVDPSGKAAVLLSSNNSNANIPKTDIVSVVKKELTGELKKGWWSIDLEGEKPITRAVPGMLVYFHIETTIPDGEEVHIELYEDDNNEKEETGAGDKDEHQPLVSTATKQPSTHEKVSNGKIIKSLRLDNLNRLIENDIDKQIELYFRCSYNGENVELPQKSGDYLAVGTLVIDRYKMPGLNATGTNIADDLTYGTGIPQKEKIYDPEQVAKFIEEYKKAGFDESKHAVFTNKEDLSSIAPAIQPLQDDDLATCENDKMPLFMEAAKIKKDNTYVETLNPEKIYKQAEFVDQDISKNLKAKYSKKEMYDVKTRSGYESGVDLKNFHEEKSPITGELRNDNYLFWNFKNTAELYFARGELQTNLDRMIAKFKSNTGGIYEDTILTKEVSNHPNTDEYCLDVEDYLAEKLKQEFKNDIANIEDKEPYFEIKKGVYSNGKQKREDTDKADFNKPAYSYNKDLWDASKGLTIALNDIWSAEVILIQLKNKKEGYTCKYKITLWDHFGLDLPDMRRRFNTYFSIKETFICWFVLQHLRGYKPFVTKITFEREFKGDFCIGKKERSEVRTKEAAIKKADEDRIERLRQIGRKKPGEM